MWQWNVFIFNTNFKHTDVKKKILMSVPVHVADYNGIHVAITFQLNVGTHITLGIWLHLPNSLTSVLNLDVRKDFCLLGMQHGVSSLLLLNHRLYFLWTESASRPHYFLKMATLICTLSTSFSIPIIASHTPHSLHPTILVLQVLKGSYFRFLICLGS